MKNFYLAEYIWFVEKTILYSGILYYVENCPG